MCHVTGRFTVWIAEPIKRIRSILFALLFYLHAWHYVGEDNTAGNPSTNSMLREEWVLCCGVWCTWDGVFGFMGWVSSCSEKKNDFIIKTNEIISKTNDIIIKINDIIVKNWLLSQFQKQPCFWWAYFYTKRKRFLNRIATFCSKWLGAFTPVSNTSWEKCVKIHRRIAHGSMAHWRNILRILSTKFVPFSG